MAPGELAEPEHREGAGVAERLVVVPDEAFDEVVRGEVAEAVLEALPEGYRHVLEFRDPTWYDARALALLERRGVALCLHDMAGSASERVVIGPFVYVRFHGPTKYGGRYSDRRLDGWAEWLSARAAGGLAVFAYFNNDIGGHAPRDAARLRERLLGRT